MSDLHPLCLHCQAAPGYRARQLCWRCSTNPAIRMRYPAAYSKFTVRGHEDFCGPGKPCEPTDTLPGTPEKVAVLEERARRGERLWHPQDATWDQAAQEAPVEASGEDDFKEKA